MEVGTPVIEKNLDPRFGHDAYKAVQRSHSQIYYPAIQHLAREGKGRKATNRYFRAEKGKDINDGPAPAPLNATPHQLKNRVKRRRHQTL